MSDSPLVSILMPAYNAERFIPEAIQSTLDQDYQNWELLILDDASTDRTLVQIERFTDSRIRVFKHEKNAGYLESCNELFALAKGELVTFLDADDLQTIDRITVCINELKRNTSLGFVTSDNMRINEVGEVLSHQNVKVDYAKMASDPSYEVYFACASLMIRREVLERVEGYHPFFKGIGGEDYHMIWELCRLTSGMHINRPLYHYRKHVDQNQFRITNPLKYFMMDILHDIRNKSISTGQNPLSDWEAYRAWWEKRVDENASEILMRKAVESLQLGRKLEALSLGLNSVTRKPLTINKMKSFARLIKRMMNEQFSAL
ncbi:MAG: glycosyltransferase [Flavobacteriales bacterium]|nr:glycosyltransferase [Flavobacteriales bacterium]